MARAVSTEPLTLNAGGHASQVERAELADLGLETSDIGTDMEIWQEAGSRRMFKLTLFRKPWPEIGQRVSWSCRSTMFVGVVGKTRLRAVHGSDRWVCDVEGVVDKFDARPVLGG